MTQSTKDAIRERRAARGRGDILGALRAERGEPAPPPPPKRRTRKSPPPPKCGTIGGYKHHRKEGEPPCTDCQAAHDKAQQSAYAPRTAPRQPAKHGTPGGYQRHLKRGETPCPDCRAANRARKTAENRRKGIKPRPPLQPCGTYAAYARHLRNREPPCTDCRAAAHEYRRGRYAHSRTTENLNGKEPAQCGTISGAHRHRRLGEPVCEDCRRAANEYQRRNYYKRQGRKETGTDKGPRQPPKPCGTSAGAKRHYKNGEPPCTDCREARNAERRARYAAKRAAAQ